MNASRTAKGLGAVFVAAMLATAFPGTAHRFDLAMSGHGASALWAPADAEPTTTGGCDQVDVILATIRAKESGHGNPAGDYTVVNTDPNATGRAAGAYQFLTGTWAGYGGFPTADAAPPPVQDARARRDVAAALAKHGDVAAVPSVWYVGDYPPRMGWDVVPAAGNTKTVRQYQQEWMAKFEELQAACRPPAPALVSPLPSGVITVPTAEHHDFPAVDIPAVTGTQISAIAAGTVSYVGGDCGLGLAVESDGLRWVYCHTSVRQAAEGDEVAAGAPLGLVGSTGNSTGPHLHIELYVSGSIRCPQPLIDVLATGQPTPALDSLPTSKPCVRSAA